MIMIYVGTVYMLYMYILWYTRYVVFFHVGYLRYCITVFDQWICIEIYL